MRRFEPKLIDRVAPVYRLVEAEMNCAMCPGWMTGGMVIGTLIGVLLIVLLVVLIVKVTRS